jgi:hypothetical protein
MGLFLSLLLSGCDGVAMRETYQEVKGLPAQIAVDTVAKLVTANELFSNTQYEHTPKTLEKIFLESEYQIIVEDYAFFYCYDKTPRLFKEVDFLGNFIVIASSKLDNDIVIQGTIPFLSQWKELKGLKNRSIPYFESILDIENGECFEIELDWEYLRSLPQNKLLKNIPSTDPSEWDKMRKEMKNFTTPIEDLLNTFDSEEKTETPKPTPSLEDLFDSTHLEAESEIPPALEKLILDIRSQK